MGGQTFSGLAVDEGEDWLMNFFGPCVNKCILQNIIIHMYYLISGNFRWDKFVFLMFASFNFRCSALPMKIKPH